MSIYLIRLGRIDSPKLIINVGNFVTSDFEEAKEVAAFFEKMNYLVEMYEEITIKDTDVRVKELNV